MEGMEVPIMGSDSVKWTEVSVPSSSGENSIVPHSDGHSTRTATTAFAPLTRDTASCSVIGDPPLYLVWRIHKVRPHTLELVQLSAGEEFPATGLRLNFPHGLSPFAFIFKDQIGSTSRNFCSLYALTVTGVAYLLKLSSISAYASCSVFPQDDFVEVNLPAYSNYEPVTSVTAMPGCLVVGRGDGSVACFQLGTLHQTASGFVHELRDHSAIGRLWGLVSRGRMAGAVQDLVISEVQEKKLLFVLHIDGIIQVWDLLCYSRVLGHKLTIPTLDGASYLRLWVGEVDCDSGVIPLAALYKRTMEGSIDMISVYSLHSSFGDRMTLSLESTMQTISLEEGAHIDVKVAYDKIWILKDNGLVFHKLSCMNAAKEEARCYALQEDFVADQLFQSFEHSSDDLLLIMHSIFSSAKEQIMPFVSSIFLRRLFLPGVYNNNVLRATLLDYNKHWTDSEFQSLNADRLKTEIISLVEHEGFSESSMSICWWKSFCARYFHYWCKSNEPLALLVQSSEGVVGLIRKHSLSLFRDLEKTELLVDGSSDELGDPVNFGVDLPDDEDEILTEVIRCITRISQQFGKSSSAIFYESLFGTPSISSEEIIRRLLKILQTGDYSSLALNNLSDLSADIAWEKELSDHRSLRKFSVDMLLSLHALLKKAVYWGKVLNVIESYLQFLVPQKTRHNSGAETIFNIGSSILVQMTSQIAKVMFESAWSILLFVNYLVSISGQVMGRMFPVGSRAACSEQNHRLEWLSKKAVVRLLTTWTKMRVVGGALASCVRGWLCAGKAAKHAVAARLVGLGLCRYRRAVLATGD
ncbi:nuclear pore complex protein NUP160-like [Carica papaya]|uniref:nuclear pore complex protein NUP160-like n=1 Tax=Carica papaya TaxID=3649 RepID=UPI000B8C8F91|nr:nuclear pore complex protein NUP160-like [Carica papaya]